MQQNILFFIIIYMEWYCILLIVIASLIILVAPIVGMFIYTFKIAKKVYFSQLVREDKNKWGRECSDTTNEEQVRMYDEGVKRAEDKNFIDVSIKSEGFNLVGKYLDNGNDTCVIIIPGRTESLLYSYYFSMPYYENKLNILVIDNRSHGLSEGYYDTLGIDEYKDILAWCKLLNEKYALKHIILHGICIGAATSIYSKINDKNNLIQALVLDGPYNNFKEIFKNHMIVDHRPIFPVLNEVMFLIKKYSGVDVVKDGPENYIDKVNISVLFLYSKEDKFVLPYMQEKIYSKCKSEHKKIVYFPKGAHSHIRINNTIEYDKTISEFLKDNLN